jgi:Arc/MetJ-type ribon-helix-helix transcriptional regulator
MTRKTTIYLPEELKAAIEREARQRRCPEAEVIRTALTEALARPRPRAGVIDAEPFAERAEELLVGFGDR